MNESTCSYHGPLVSREVFAFHDMEWAFQVTIQWEPQEHVLVLDLSKWMMQMAGMDTAESHSQPAKLPAQQPPVASLLLTYQHKRYITNGLPTT